MLSGNTVVLDSLTITNGNAGDGGGGGIVNIGTLTLNQCALAGNTAAGVGGIYNGDTLTMNQIAHWWEIVVMGKTAPAVLKTILVA